MVILLILVLLQFFLNVIYEACLR